jgi:hypothetical protein
LLREPPREIAALENEPGGQECARWRMLA